VTCSSLVQEVLPFVKMITELSKRPVRGLGPEWAGRAIEK
jgi:hypothetical protein